MNQIPRLGPLNHTKGISSVKRQPRSGSATKPKIVKGLTPKSIPHTGSLSIPKGNESPKSPVKIPKLSSQPNMVEYFREINTPAQNKSFDDNFDAFVENIECKPLNEAAEFFGKTCFNAEISVLWVVREKNYFSPSFKMIVPKGGILEEVENSNNFIILDSQNQNVHFKKNIDASIISEGSSILIIPFSVNGAAPRYILQLGKARNKSKFNDRDLINVNCFMNKMKIYSSLIFNPLNQVSESKGIVKDLTVENIISSLKKFFHCKEVKMICYKPKNNCIIPIYDEDFVNTCDLMNEREIGFAKEGLLKEKVINFPHVGDCPNYYEPFDGPKDNPGLSVPFKDHSGIIWAINIYGSKDGRPFTTVNEQFLAALSPFIAKILNYIFHPPHMNGQLENFENRLKALLEVAEILSGVLDIDILLPTIMDRACQLLNAERCSLFLVDTAHHELVTRFHGGLQNAIRLKIGRGIVGSCAESGEIVNIRDAYADQRFDRSVDLATGFTTKSLLCIPIYNNRGEITGVTEMINKKDEGLFDEDDEKMLMAFNVFCGISLDNARLYKASLDLTKQLRSFIQTSLAINATDTLQSTLEEIMSNIMSIVNASRVTIFLISENNNQLFEHLSIGDGTTYGTMFAQEAVHNRKFMLFDHQAVLGHAQTQQLNKAIERILAAGLDADIMVFGADNFEEEEEEGEFYEDENDDFTAGAPAIDPLKSKSSQQSKSNIQSNSIVNNASRATNAISMVKAQKEIENQAKENTEVVCCLPMFSSENTILGVIEILCNWKVMSEDIKLLDCFSVFAAVSVERSQLKDRTKLGQVDVEMKQWISERERGITTQIPSKLLISMDKLNQILIVKFDAPKWDGIGHVKVLYAIFDIFDLMNTFQITNEKLFKFIFEVRDTYNKVPYHNWRHAVDVTQFTTYQILTGGLDTVFTKSEIFGLIVAAICHDAGHDGFTNVYNEKAQTPLGILFKNQSVMETHHCSVAINIISRDECNLFSSLSSTENKNMWTYIIQLILSTDMAKHFDILKELNTLIDDKQFSMGVPEHRLLLLQVLLKCSDISNVARPFELADKWCDVLCEEFFRQGDLEKASGMEFSSALNDREHLDKPKSQIGFYQFVCLPLFQAMAKVVPRLDCNVNQLLSNLEQWKKATAQNEGQNR